MQIINEEREHRISAENKQGINAVEIYQDKQKSIPR
jgi:hypothetical protein